MNLEKALDGIINVQKASGWRCEETLEFFS
jgi:hypothetical protein